MPIMCQKVHRALGIQWLKGKKHLTGLTLQGESWTVKSVNKYKISLQIVISAKRENNRLKR